MLFTAITYISYSVQGERFVTEQYCVITPDISLKACYKRKPNKNNQQVFDIFCCYLYYDNNDHSGIVVQSHLHQKLNVRFPHVQNCRNILQEHIFFGHLFYNNAIGVHSIRRSQLLLGNNCCQENYIPTWTHTVHPDHRHLEIEFHRIFGR